MLPAPNRNILHLNVVNFYAAVVQALSPRLRSYPLAIVTPGTVRQMVLGTSAVAFEAGVRKGMLLDTARRTCPDLRIHTPQPRFYDRAYTVMCEEACRLSPRVEPAGPGHLFVDLTGTDRLWGNPLDSGHRLRKTIREKLRFDAAVGVASNKLVSKVATRVIKPTGLCRIVEGCEEEFLAPLPVSLLPGVDPDVITHMMQFNIGIIKDLVFISERQLAEVFGSHAPDIYRRARGIDTTPVRECGKPSPTIRETAVFEGQTNNDTLVRRELFRLISHAAARVRKLGLATERVRLGVTYSDGARAVENCKLRTPLSGDLSLYDQALKLLERVYVRRVRLADMTLILSELCFPYGQLDLFDNTGVEEHLMKALDRVRDKFGHGVIGFYGKERGE